MPRWRLRSVPAPAPAPAPAPSHSLSVSIAPALSLPFSPSSFPVPLPLARGGALSTLPLQLPPDLPSLSLSDGTSPLPFLSLASPFTVSLPPAGAGGIRRRCAATPFWPQQSSAAARQFTPRTITLRRPATIPIRARRRPRCGPSSMRPRWRSRATPSRSSHPPTSGCCTRWRSLA